MAAGFSLVFFWSVFALTVGSTGQSTGPHLHYELTIDGQQVDPLEYLTPPEED